MRQRGGGGGGSAAGLPLYQGDATTTATNTPSSGNNRLSSNSSRGGGATRQRRRPSDSGGAGSSLAISSTMSSSSWEITRSSNSTSDDDEKDIEAGGSGSQQAIRRQRQRPTRRRTNQGGGRTGGLYVDSGSDLLLASSENDMDDDEGDYDELDLQSDHEQQQRQPNLYYPAPLSNPQQQQQQALSFHSLSNWQQQQQQQYQNGSDHQQFYQKQLQQQQQMIIPTSPSSSSSLLLRRLHQSNLHQHHHHYNRGSNASLQDFHTVYRTPLHVPDYLYHDYIMSGSNSSLSSSLGGFHNNKQQHQRYLGHGGYNTVRRRQGRQRQGRQATAPIVTRTCFASYCGGFSAVASIFLIFVGILLDTQPLLIKGSLHQQVTSYSSNDGFGGSSRVVKKRYLVPRGTEGERLPSAHAAYQASLAYFVVVLLCWYVSNPTWINARIYRLRNKYQDIPDHTSSVSSNLPTFHAHDGSNNTGADGGIDNVNSSSEAERGVISAAYHQGFLGGAAYLWRRFTNFGRQWLASRGWYYYAPSSRRRHKYSTKRDV